MVGDFVQKRRIQVNLTTGRQVILHWSHEILFDDNLWNADYLMCVTEVVTFYTSMTSEWYHLPTNGLVILYINEGYQ